MRLRPVPGRRARQLAQPLTAFALGHEGLCLPDSGGEFLLGNPGRSRALLRILDAGSKSSDKSEQANGSLSVDLNWRYVQCAGSRMAKSSSRMPWMSTRVRKWASGS
jgi:hypothetical protein